MDKKQIFGRHYKRLVAAAILHAVLSGVALALTVNAVFAFLYWMLGFGAVWLGVPIGVALGAIFGILLYFLKYRMSDEMLARAADSYGLEERMVTMVELREEDSFIAQLQREDALDKLGALPEERIKFKMSPLSIAVISVGATASIFLGVLGALAHGGKIPYGKDLLSEGDGTYEIVYAVEGGGYIRGESEQSIGFGEDGMPVRAIAENGWMFVGWSDGATSPERSESDVKADMHIKAVFERIDHKAPDADDSDAADDLPYASVIEEGGGSGSDELGGENIKDDSEGGGGGKWQDRNQFIDGATYYRDYLEFYYQYATGIFESDTEIPPEVIAFFELYFKGI